MKTITSLLFLLIPFMGFSQDADIMYVPDQNTIVGTYNSNYSPIGYAHVQLRLFPSKVVINPMLIHKSRG